MQGYRDAVRDRYYIRFEKVLKPYTKILDEFNHHQYLARQAYLKEYPENYATQGWHTDEQRAAWFLEHHNIVISKNANGIIKLGFATAQDVTLFTLRNS